MNKLEFIKEFDWDIFRREQIIQAAHDMLPSYCTCNITFENIMELAVEFADELIKVLKKDNV